MKSEAFNMDCMEYMRQCRDKQFNLAIVDPPYGVEDMTGKEFSHGRGKLRNRIFQIDCERIDKWDVAPPQEYFDELFRISEIILIYLPLDALLCGTKYSRLRTFQLLKLHGQILMSLQSCLSLIIGIQGKYILCKNLLNYINGF